MNVTNKIKKINIKSVKTRTPTKKRVLNYMLQNDTVLLFFAWHPCYVLPTVCMATNKHTMLFYR